MTRWVHLDPASGVSGDMLLGVAIELGFDPHELTLLAERLGLTGVEVRCARVRRGALVGTKVDVRVRGVSERPAISAQQRHEQHHEHHHHHHAHPDPHGHASPAGHGRVLAETLALVDRVALPERARWRARRTFELLFTAEAKVHDRPIESIHLHEAGGDDALIDIVGTCLALDRLQIAGISCSVPLPLGGGVIHCAHGILPVPAPAVAELLRELPVVGGPVAHELITPTGAALLRTIVDRFGPAPEMILHGIACGAGGRDVAELPNVLRGLAGEPRDGGPLARDLAVLETALDDIAPQDLPPLIERLVEAGARDAWTTPVLMKKGRPGFHLTVIADPALTQPLAMILLRDSPTLGVRWRREQRLEWDRRQVVVETPWGAVRIKRALDAAGREIKSRPEFDDCRARAEERGVSIDHVRRDAQRAYDDATGDASKDPR